MQSFKIAKLFTKICLFVFFFTVQVSVKAWELDLSRRQKELTRTRMPASITDSEPASKTDTALSGVMESFEPTQEVVILNTERGFVPETLRLKKGQKYQIHVVNVNEKDKNISFILDAFSEHHATYFGQEKTFSIAPKTEGIFSYQCPETAKQGKIVIISESERKPASVETNH